MFNGSFVAVVTPFDKENEVNFEKLGQLIDWHIESGTDGIVVLGTTGEAPSLSDQERVKIVQFTLKRANGRILVIAGSGFNNTEHAVKLSKEFSDLGVDGLLIVNPYYNKGNNKGLIAHYREIARNVKTPIILYNVPSRTGKHIDYEVVYELSKCDNIVAIKDASGDLNYSAKIIKNIKNFSVLSGNDDIVVPMMSIGGKGVISVAANIIPKQFSEMVHLALRGDFEKARQIQLEYLDLINNLFIEVNPIPVRAAMNILGFEIGAARLPLDTLEKANELKLIEILSQFDI